MMDSVEKIRRDGKSTLLSSLADRVGNVVSSGSTPSCNLERDTVIGEPAKKVVTVSSLSELSIGNSVEAITVSQHGCNEGDMRVLDLSRFANLKTFVVNELSFLNVEEVKLIGLKKLERVEIGSVCFTRNLYNSNPNRRFYLKNCERLKELKIGSNSFVDYTVCEIENNESLEVIEIGELHRQSINFKCDSALKLKSDCDGMI